MSDEHPRTDSADERMAEVRAPIPATPSDVAGVLERLDVLRDAYEGERDRTIPHGIAVDAKALIESLAHDREVMREALEPFGAEKWGDLLPDDVPIFPAQAHAPTGIAAGDFRRARAALASLKGGA